jgi:hypothetical protein
MFKYQKKDGYYEPFNCKEVVDLSLPNMWRQLLITKKLFNLKIRMTNRQRLKYKISYLSTNDDDSRWE